MLALLINRALWFFLDVVLTDQNLTATWHAADDMKSRSLELNVALLGMDRVTSVSAGENRSKRLSESFIVLAHHKLAANSATTPDNKVMFQGSLPTKTKAQAIAFWITEEYKLTPLQATGGWLSTVN